MGTYLKIGALKFYWIHIPSRYDSRIENYASRAFVKVSVLDSF